MLIEPPSPRLLVAAETFFRISAAGRARLAMSSREMVCTGIAPSSAMRLIDEPVIFTFSSWPAATGSRCGIAWRGRGLQLAARAMPSAMDSARLAERSRSGVR